MLIYLGVVSTIADVDSKLSIDRAEDSVASVTLPWISHFINSHNQGGFDNMD